MGPILGGLLGENSANPYLAQQQQLWAQQQYASHSQDVMEAYLRSYATVAQRDEENPVLLLLDQP